MGIFMGIEVLFFSLGVLSTLLVVGFFKMKQFITIDWKGTILAFIGMFLFVFCIAWSVSSVLENEPQAATMGLLIFGLPVLVIFGIFRRLIHKVDSTVES
jgi:hypothetical protein